MPVQLRICWSGDVPGLNEHRLSVAAFSASLEALLAALRRIATNLVGSAVDSSEDASATGRYANAARRLDIEIGSIEDGGSAVANCIVSMRELPGQPLDLFNELPRRAGVELLDAIEQESKGILRNAAVRKYLSVLPDGLHGHDYELFDAGVSVRTVQVREVRLAEIPDDLPYLREIVGEVIGVGFEPGRNEVRLRAQGGQATTLLAESEQVDLALSRRNAQVRVLAIQDKKPRLLRLESCEQPRYTPTEKDRTAYILEKWSGLLQRLAK